MKKFGFVASGGGYRSFYTAGALVWLKKHDIPVTHITSTSSGNNIVMDYLLWDWQQEELPPVLTKTVRLSLKDIFHVFSNFLGLKPSFLPNGSFLFTVDKQRCRKSLQLDDPQRREILHSHLGEVRWDIATTNLSKRKRQTFNINDVLSQIDELSLDRLMDIFLAGITTIPYFKAITMDGDYFMEGGYMDNTPMRTLFEDPEVDEIIAVDFTDYDYHAEIEKIYATNAFTLPLNSIDMYLLVSDIQLTLPNSKVFTQAALINKMLASMGKESIEIEGKTYYNKPLHVLKPKNLESMTIALKDSTIQKKYYELGSQEMSALQGNVLGQQSA